MTMAARTVDAVTLSIISHVEKQMQDLRSNYDLTRKYYNGEHRVLLSDRLKAFLPNDLKGQFRDNFMEVVVNAVANRLTVIGLESDNEALAEYLWDQWQRDRMDRLQRAIHVGTVMQGDGYVLVEWDDEEGRPRFHQQSPELMWPHYNAARPDQLDMISKVWTEPLQLGREEVRTRLNLYYPDRIEKFISDNRAWQQFIDPEDESDDWPTPNVRSDGSPLGIPIVHFRNDALDADFGTSELNNAIPLQDLLNKSIIDVVMTADTMGFPQRWLLNVDADLSTMDIVPGAVNTFMSSMDDAAVGQWEAADITKLLDAVEMWVNHISAVTTTPQHLFKLSGQVPSGEALKTAEAGLVSKVVSRQVEFGQSWEDVMRIAQVLAAEFGSEKPGGDVEAEIRITWKDPETRNEKEHLEGLGLKVSQLGIPQEQAWREAGYTPEQIEQMRKDQDAEMQRGANVGAAILARFDRGEGLEEPEPVDVEG